MPTLLVFAPCEKVIVSQEDNTPSLISFLNTLQVSIPATQEVNIPSDVSFPMRWSIFALWRRVNGDEGKLFQQRTVLITPSGQETVKTDIEFRMAADVQHNTISIFGFPVTSVGQCSLKLLLREAGQEGQWSEIAEYPIRIARR